MKNLLSSLAIVVVLAALGLSTVVALPRGMDVTASAPVAAANSLEARNAEAPSATNTFNVIAMPLDSQSQFADEGLSFNAQGLMALIGPSVQQVLEWDAATQTYKFYFPDGFGTNFPLKVGGAYWLEVDATSPAVVSFVGDVPAQGSVMFDFLGGATCQFNDFSLPLDKSSLTTASALAADIGDVEQILEWDASTQTYRFYFPADGFGTNFPTKIGYPYHVCMTASKTWPQ